MIWSDALVGKIKQVERMVRQFERLGQVDLKKILGDGEGALEVEAPLLAVREQTHPHFPRGLHIDAAEVLQHLRRWYAIVALRCAVECTFPSLGLQNSKAVLESFPLIRLSDRSKKSASYLSNNVFRSSSPMVVN